jgi:hypothetical protein
MAEGEELTEEFDISRRVPNTDDSLHCTQAALVMALDALGHSATMTMEEAEKVTSFREGVETWPYHMLAWLGENGYRIRHVDALDPVALMGDPEQTLRDSGLDEETLAYILGISDFQAESEAIRRCLRSGNVEFLVRIPEVDELLDSMTQGWLPVISLDAAVLAERPADGFEGHIVLATGREGEMIIVQDSGPPPRWDWRVSPTRLLEALHSPVDTSGTVSYVRKAHTEG